uniref:EF-hand domain-containing protein n=1 Tax=Acrobeloides nanus TaxID=290746 RepID=A0A914CZJ3_9BILA
MAKKLWKITDEKQIREGFDAIDKSGDGKITVQEFRDFYMGIANEDLDEYLDKMIKEFDVDGNGVIEYPEFWIMAKKLWKELDEKSIEHDFKTIDKSGDGKLSVDELRAYFKEHTSKKAPEKQEPKKEEPKKQEVHEKKEEKTKEDGANLFQKFTNVQPGGTTWYTTTNCSPQTFYYTSRGG